MYDLKELIEKLKKKYEEERSDWTQGFEEAVADILNAVANMDFECGYDPKTLMEYIDNAKDQLENNQMRVLDKIDAVLVELKENASAIKKVRLGVIVTILVVGINFFGIWALLAFLY